MLHHYLYGNQLALSEEGMYKDTTHRLPDKIVTVVLIPGLTSTIWAFYRLFGFFLGSTLTGGIIYYSLLDEYKLSNELLTEDIYVRPFPSLVSGSRLELPGDRQRRA